MRGLSADQTGIAALRYQRDPVLAGKLANRGDFRSRARPQHQRRAAVKQVALFGDIGRDVSRVRDRIFGADDLAEPRDQFGRERRRRWLDDIHCLLLFLALAHFRPTAARRSRSLIASPRPSSGTGITAMARAPLASSARR